MLDFDILDFEPRLYIIMRRDLQDMNPGKGMAQAAHAQADFDAAVLKNKTITDLVKQWRDGRTFGTTLVLHETEDTIRDIVTKTAFSGMTVDPTYPWRNFYGDVFLTEEVTCAWVFVTSNEDSALMKTFNLHS